MIKDKTGKELSGREIAEKMVVRAASIGLDFNLMVLRWVGFIPSRRIRKIIYQMNGMTIGNGSTLHMWANFYEPKNITIGEDTIIGDHAFLDGRDKLTIGNHVDIASSVLIYNSEHDINSEDFHAVTAPVVIGDYVFIGPRVTILPGV